MNTSLLGLRHLGTALQKSEYWFLMYTGSSPDGMGPGTFIGRTKDYNVALKYLIQEVESDSYSTGYVLAISDTHCYKVRSVSSLDSLIL